MPTCYKVRFDRSRIFCRQEAEQAQAVREEYTRAIGALHACWLSATPSYLLLRDVDLRARKPHYVSAHDLPGPTLCVEFY